MTRLIDADALREQFKDRSLEDFTYLHFIDAIDNAPTIEYSKNSLDYDYGFAEGLKRAREKYEGRPQGEWEIVDAEGGKIWNCVCTECGHDPQEYIGGTEDWWLRKPLPNYCPNCGVRIVNVRGDYE